MQVRKIHVEKRINEIVNRLNKTKVEKHPDLKEEKEERDRREREDQKAKMRDVKKREKEEDERRKKEAEERSAQRLGNSVTRLLFYFYTALLFILHFLCCLYYTGMRLFRKSFDFKVIFFKIFYSYSYLVLVFSALSEYFYVDCSHPRTLIIFSRHDFV